MIFNPVNIKVLLLFIFLFGRYKNSFSQQNLFNVPSSEITKKNKIFFQQQFNIFKSNLASNTTLDFGLGKNYEIGLNLLDVNYALENNHFLYNNNIENGSLFPQALVNFQKGWDINKNIVFSIGTQLGSSSSAILKNIISYNYLSSNINAIPEKLSLIFGILDATPGYAKDNNTLGIQAGFEYKFIKKMSVMSDYISGKSDIGVSVCGLVFYPISYFPISFGYIIPNPKSNNLKGAVLEITLLPKTCKNLKSTKSCIQKK